MSAKLPSEAFCVCELLEVGLEGDNDVAIDKPLFWVGGVLEARPVLLDGGLVGLVDIGGGINDGAVGGLGVQLDLRIGEDQEPQEVSYLVEVEKVALGSLMLDCVRRGYRQGSRTSRRGCISSSARPRRQRGCPGPLPAECSPAPVPAAGTVAHGRCSSFASPSAWPAASAPAIDTG